MKPPADKWEVKPLRLLPLQIIDGDRSARYPKRAEFQDAGVLFLNTTNIVEDHLDLNAAVFVTEEKFNEIKKGRVQRNDILMTTRGSIGKVALFNCQHNSALINAQMLILRANTRHLDPHFLFHTFRSRHFKASLANFASGSAQPQIPITDLREVEISLPSLPTQKKIAAVLSAYDDLIENNERRIRILEDMAQNLYREWFVKFRFPGHKQVKMVDSPLGKIPQGWVVGPLNDVVENLRNGTNAGDHLQNRKYVPIDCIGKKTLTLSQHEPWENAQSSLILFEKGDILFGAMRPYFHKVAVASWAGVTRTTCLVLRPREVTCTGYAAYVLFQEETVAYATAHSKGATIPYTAWDGTMSEMGVVIPPVTLAHDFSVVAEPMLQLASGLAAKNASLRQTRDLLLPKLISGEVDVSELDIQYAS